MIPSRRIAIVPKALECAGFLMGEPQRASCDNRFCPDRTAPVFVVGTRLLCARCRDFRNALIKLRLPEIRSAR